MAGRRWVVETDIANCFSAIPHEKLMQAVEERVSDQAVLKLLRAMLRAGVMEDGVVRREVTGTPQGGVISPLLCNVYLHRIDRVWDMREHGVLVRYRRRRGGDVPVPGAGGGRAGAAAGLLAELGLEPKAAKTRIVHLGRRGRGTGFPRLPPPAGARQGRTGGKARRPSSPAGPRTRRCSMRATGSGS